MELKEFIRNVVLDVIEGVQLTQLDINSKGIKAIVNPTRDQHAGVSLEGDIFDYYDTNKIEITAAITAVKEKEAGVSIKVLSGDMRAKTETTSSVKFSVPVLLPPPVLSEDFKAI